MIATLDLSHVSRETYVGVSMYILGPGFHQQPGSSQIIEVAKLKLSANFRWHIPSYHLRLTRLRTLGRRWCKSYDARQRYPLRGELEASPVLRLPAKHEFPSKSQPLQTLAQGEGGRFLVKENMSTWSNRGNPHNVRIRGSLLEVFFVNYTYIYTYIYIYIYMMKVYRSYISLWWLSVTASNLMVWTSVYSSF